MLFLPAIQGRYAVGVTTFVTPVHPPRPIGSVKLRNGSGNSNKGESKPALLLEEVAYTAYYPADVSVKSKKGVDWFIRFAFSLEIMDMQCSWMLQTYQGIFEWVRNVFR
jgi:platelet-activating factor acetylhydrolase